MDTAFIAGGLGRRLSLVRLLLSSGSRLWSLLSQPSGPSMESARNKTASAKGRHWLTLFNSQGECEL